MYYRLRIPPFCWPLYPPPQALHSSSLPLSFPSSLSPTSLPLRHIPFFLSPNFIIAGAIGPRNYLFNSICLPQRLLPRCFPLDHIMMCSNLPVSNQEKKAMRMNMGHFSGQEYGPLVPFCSLGTFALGTPQGEL